MSRKILTYKAVSVLLGTSLVMSAYADTYAQNLYTTEYYENDITVMSDNGVYIDTDNFVDFDYAFEGVSEGYDTDNSVNGNAVSNQGERGVPCFWNNDGKYSMEYQTDRGYMNNYVITTGGKSGIIYVGEIEEVQAIGGITLRGSSSENNSTYKVYAMDTSEFDFSAAPSFENAELIASGTMNAADSSWYKKVDDNAAVMEDFSISGQMGIFVEITATSGANYDGMSFSMRNIYNVRDLNAVSDDGKVTLSWTPPVSGLVENVIVSYFNGSQEIKTDVVPASDGIYVFEGLENGTEYTFTVKSDYEGAETPETITAVPYKFEGLKSVYGEQNKNRIILSWELPDNSAYTSITIKDEAGEETVLNGDETSFTIVNRENRPGTYKYYITVQDGLGNSDTKEVSVDYIEYVQKDVSIRDFIYTGIGAYSGGEFSEDPENGIITIKGKSSDISTSLDSSLDYVYVPLDHTSLIEDGDKISISAKLNKFPAQTSQNNDFKNIKAGIMYRNTKDDYSFDGVGSASVNMVVSPASSGLSSDPYRLMYSYRGMSGNPAQISDVKMSPDDYSYMRLEGTKTGNDLEFRYYYSADGESWTDSGITYTEKDALLSDTGYYGLFSVGKNTEVSVSFSDIKINDKLIDFEAPEEHDVTRVDTYSGDSGVKLSWVAPKSDEAIYISWNGGELELPAGSTECEIKELTNDSTYQFDIKTESELSKGVTVTAVPRELKSVTITDKNVNKQYAELIWNLPQNNGIITGIKAHVIKDGSEIYTEDLGRTSQSFTTKDKLRFEVDTDYTIIITVSDILGNERSAETVVRYDYDGSPLAQADDRKAVFTWNESCSYYNDYDKLNFYINGNLAASAAMTDNRAAIPYLVNGVEYEISIKGEKDGAETDLNDVSVVTPSGNIQFEAVGIGGATATASTENGILTVNVVNGGDMWSVPDKFAYYCMQVTGDISMTIKVEAFGSNNNAWARQGLMVRENLNDNSRFVGAAVVPYHADSPYGVAREARTVEDSTAVRDEIKGTVHEGEYLRMTKKGNYVYTEVSVDGINWTDKSQKQIGFDNDTYYIGITKAKDDSDGFRISEIYIDDINIAAPEPVENLRVSETLDKGAVIEWDKPKGDSDIYDSYLISWSTADGVTNEKTVGKDETSCTIDGLENNKLYTISVKTVYNNEKYSKEVTTEVTPYSIKDPVIPKLEISGGSSINKGETKTFDLSLDKNVPLRSIALNFECTSGLSLSGFEKNAELENFDVEVDGNRIMITSKTGKAEYIENLGKLKVSASSSASSTQNFTLSGEAEYYNEAQDSSSPTKTVSITEEKQTLSISSSSSGNSGGGGGGGGVSTSGGSASSTTPQKYFGEQPQETSRPQDTQTAELRFADDSDIPSWAYDAVYSLYKSDAISGIEQDGMIMFNPNAEVTREEFVKMLIGAVGKLDADAQCSFTDVPENEWYYQYIASAYNDGIVTGRDDGSFGIGDKISRQDMAVMLMRAAEVYEIDIQSINTAIDFSDKAEIADYAVDAVMSAQQSGIMTGTDDDKFDPMLTATRAMAATVIYRLTN